MPASQVDEQVVKMSFDNSNFDSNINDSIRTLNTLDRSLALFNSKESLNNINTSFNNLAHTFSIKGQIMFGVLNSLGKEIYGLGKRAFGSLTKGIKDGLGEYKTIIDSTEAIYQNVKQNGNSLQDVNNALDELNDYADKTIYNFGQMTRMIGMFSSAGVGLKDSVNSIKGLSNAAALVGANMQRAQIGWNAVSRAMSSGKFTNMTWRSLELSGIAGKQFNKVITEVARNMHVKGKKTGKDIDGMIKKYGSLRESLQEGWLKKDVFAEAMAIMSGELSRADLEKKKYSKKQIDELLAIAEAAEEAATKVKTFQQLMETISEAIGSGWAQSFRILLGDLEQAKKLYTRISNVISDFIDNNANIRNELFKRIINGKDKGIDGKWRTSRDTFRQIIENMLAIIKTFLKSVKTGFLNIFPIDRIAAAARKFLDVFEKFTRSFVIASGKVNKAGDTLWNTSDVEQMSDAIKDLIKFFRGLASAVDIAWMAISQPIKVIVQRIPFFNNFFNNTNSGLVGIIKKLGQFGDKITAFRDATKDWEIFGFITEYILDNIDQLGEKYPVLGLIVSVFKSLRNAADRIKLAFKQMEIKPLSAAFGLFKMVVTSLWKALNGLFGVIRGAARSVDWSWLEGPKNILKNILKVLSDYGRGLLDFEETSARITGAITGTFNKVTNTFGKVSSGAGKIKTATHSMEKQFKNLNVTVNSTGKKVQSVWEKVKSFFGSIADFFKNMSKNSDMTFEGIAKKIALIGGGVTAAALSISHLSKSLKKINILSNLNDLLGTGIDVLKAYQKQAQSKTIVNIAIAVGLLAAAMAALAFIPYEQLENGLAVFTAFMAVLSMTLTSIIKSLTEFNTVLGKTRKELTQFDVLNNMTTQLGQIGMKLAKGFNKQSLGKMFKDVAIAVFILVGALAALVLLFKLDKDATVKAIHALAGIIAVLAVMIGVLVIAMNKFSKTATNFAGTFSQFAKLAGVSGIIISLSLAVLVLVGAMAVLANINENKIMTSVIVIMSLITFLGVVGVAVAGVMSNISLGDIGKLKKITVKLTGAVVGIAAFVGAMAVLIKVISKDNTNSWIYALTLIVGIMSVFAVSLIAIMTYAKHLTGEDKAIKNLNKIITSLTVCMLALSAGLYALSYAKSIPTSIVVTIGIITAAVVSLFALIAIVTANSKNAAFATDFVKVIQGLSFAVSALTASLGIMAAGLAAFIMAISSLNLSSGDAKKSSNAIIEKLEYAGEVIEKSIPGLKTLFTKLGITAAEIFTSFTTSFFDTITAIGDKYDSIIEKVVNLIINILGKIVGVIHERRDEIAKIITDLVNFLGTEIAAAINAFFGKNGKPIISSDQVLNWIGIGGVALAVGKIALSIMSNFNTIVNAIKNFNTAWTAFKGIPIIAKIGTGLEKIYWYLVSVKEVIEAAIGGPLWMVAVAIAGIAAAITAVRGAWKRWTGEVQDSYKMEDLFSLKGLEQVLVDGFEKVGRVVVQFGLTLARLVFGALSGIVYALSYVLTTPIRLLLDFISFVLSFINKDASKTVKSWSNNITKTIGKIGEAASGSFKSIGEGWKDVLNDEAGDINDLLIVSGKNSSKNYKQGKLDGLDGMDKELSEKVIDANKKMIDADKKSLKEASPSKVSYGIYWNYILGAKNALTAGGKELTKVMESNNKKLIKETITGSKTLEEAYDKIGIKLNKREGLHQYTVGYNEYNNDGSVQYKIVELNRELTESILAQKEALIGKSKVEAEEFINQQAYVLGIQNREAEVAKLTNYLYDQHTDRTSLWWSTVTDLEKATEMSWGTILSEEEEASMKAVSAQQKTNGMVAEAAEDLKKKLVGKKKEQAQEILKQELIARGMSEEQAEEESHKMIALTMAQRKSNGKIKAQSLQDAADIMKAERDMYEKSLNEQTQLLEKALAERTKATAEASKMQDEMAKKAQAGAGGNAMPVGEYLQALKKKMAAEEEVNVAQANLDAIVKAAAKRLEDKKLLNANQFQKDYEKYYKQASKNNGKSSGNIKDVISNWWKQATGSIPKGIDTTTWKMPVSNTGDGLKDKGKDAVDTSKDLKNKLEKNRADLTPTIDLDRLSNEAKKANGIVTSSLMAAQNASIGDYINRDSELNPFMKDRWQNVYNFTQNNYSPKALSRIDIYRQTQRQLGMSRGF